MTYSLNSKRIWVAGSNGMVGSALVRRLQHDNCTLLGLEGPRIDLRRQEAVEAFMHEAKPQVVFIAAARVGGIHANDAFPATFLYDNLAIEANLIEASRKEGVEKLLFLGSSCIYPKAAPQPMKEDSLLTGPLEPTNEWYAIAKIAGIKLCQAYRKQYGCDFISAMPTNLYGPNDNFHPDNSHAPAALLRRFHEAKLAGQEEVVVWGSGRPLREFLHVDDLADACIFLMQNYSGEEHVNIGYGSDISIAEFAELIRACVGFAGRITYDTSRPDGTPRKLMNSDRLLTMGWKPRRPLAEGLQHYYAWFLANEQRLREVHL